MLVYKIQQISNDIERKKIIQRQIKSAEITPTVIRYPFGIGIRDVKAREVIVHSYIPSYYQQENGWDEGRDCFYVIPNGGTGPIILDIAPDEYTEGVDPTFHSYKDNVDYYFNDIAPEIFEIRFRDVPKKQKRNLKKEKELDLIGDMLSLKEISDRYQYSYNTLYGRISRGEIESTVIGGKHYLKKEDVEALIASDNDKNERIGNRVSLLDIVKKYRIGYSVLRYNAINGKLPCEFIDGKCFVLPNDAEKFAKELKRRK